MHTIGTGSSCTKRCDMQSCIRGQIYIFLNGRGYFFRRDGWIKKYVRGGARGKVLPKCTKNWFLDPGFLIQGSRPNKSQLNQCGPENFNGAQICSGVHV